MQRRRVEAAAEETVNPVGAGGLLRGCGKGIRDRLYWAGLIALLISLLGSGLAAAGWPPGVGVLTNNGHTEWPGVDGGAVCAWRVDLPAPVRAGPVVDDAGRVFIAVGDEVLAFSQDGDRLWSAKVGYIATGCLSIGPGSGGPGDQSHIYVGIRKPAKLLCLSGLTGLEVGRIPLPSAPSSAALVTSDGIYFGADDGKVRAYTLEGVLLWSHPTGGEPVRLRPAQGEAGIILVVDYGGDLLAIDPVRGSRLWYCNAGMSVTMPVVGPDGSVYLGQSSGAARRVAADGRPMWTCPLGGAAGTPTVLPDGSVVYPRSDGKYCLLNAAGEVQWINGKAGDDCPVLQPIVDSCGIIHAVSSDGLTGWNAAGETVWTLDIEGEAIATFVVPSAQRLLVATGEPALAMYLHPDLLGDQGWRPIFSVPEPSGLAGWHVSKPAIQISPESSASRPPGATIRWLATSGAETESGLLDPSQDTFTFALQGEVSVGFVDEAGVPFDVAPIDLKVDCTPPRVVIADLPAAGGVIAAGTFTPHIIATDGHSGTGPVQTSLDGVAFEGSCAAAPGTHCLRVEVTDLAGNTTVVEREFTASAQCSATSLSPVVVGPSAARIPPWSRWVTILVRVPTGQGTALSDPRLGGVEGLVAARLPARATTGYRAFLLRFPREPVAAALAAASNEGAGKSIIRATLTLGFSCGDQPLASSVSMLYRP